MRLDDPAAVKGRRVLVIEDGPTITHGGMAYGAGYVAAMRGRRRRDRRSAARGTRRDRRGPIAAYPHIGRVLPALGYGPSGASGAGADRSRRAPADVVVSATPIDLARLIPIAKPVVRARYEYAELGEPRLSTLVDAFLDGLAERSS